MGREITLSKAMSYLLRHGAEKEGVKIDEAGWVRVEDLVSFFCFFMFFWGMWVFLLYV